MSYFANQSNAFNEFRSGECLSRLLFTLSKWTTNPTSSESCAHAERELARFVYKSTSKQQFRRPQHATHLSDRVTCACSKRARCVWATAD